MRNRFILLLAVFSLIVAACGSDAEEATTTTAGGDDTTETTAAGGGGDTDAGGQTDGGDLLEGDGVRLRYAYEDGSELHYEVAEGLLSGLELLEEGRVVQWVDVTMAAGARYPLEARYRNLTEFRELTIVRESLEEVDRFDPDIWDPAQ